MKTQMLAAAAALAATAAFGQSGAPSLPSPAGAKSVVEETARVLSGATLDGRAETGRLNREKSGGPNRAEQVAATATLAPGTEAQKLVQSLEQRLQPALDAVDPKGRALIAQSATAPAMRAPDPDVGVPTARAVAATGAAGTPTSAAAAKDSGGKGTPDGKDKPKSSRIEIISQGDLYFDSAQSMAVFTDDVVVDHPQFHMTCDELEVYMLKDGEKKEEKKDDKTTAAAPPADAAAGEQDAKIKEAIGKGRKVVIRKLDEHGDIQVGVCRQATYIGESGDVVMREMPQVQRGQNVIIATDPATYMVIKQNGELKVHGPARTEIIQKEDKAKPKPDAAAPVVPKATGVASPAGKTKSSKPSKP